jgi:hypothetical protein
MRAAEREEEQWSALRARRRRWAERLRRVFAVEVEVCPRGGGAMRMVGLVTEPGVITRLLAHLKRRGVDARAGPWAGAVTGSTGRFAAPPGAGERSRSRRACGADWTGEPAGGSWGKCARRRRMALRDGVWVQGGRVQSAGSGRGGADGRVPAGASGGRKPWGGGREGVSPRKRTKQIPIPHGSCGDGIMDWIRASSPEDGQAPRHARG